MKNLIRISALATMLVLISVAGFSQKTCSIKIKNVGSSVPQYTANVYLVNTTTNPVTKIDQVLFYTIYTGMSNNVQMNISLNPALDPIFRYVVEVTDGNGTTVQGVSALFSSSDYMTNNIPVTINF
jgi:hypothetical protein